MKNLRKKLWGLILSGVLGFVSVPTVMYAQVTVIYEELDLINAGKASEGIVADFTAELVEDEELEEDSRYVSYVSNDLAGALVPGKNGIAVLFTNYGIDKISSVTFTVSIYNHLNGYVDSTTKTLTNLVVGTTTYVWKIAKSKSIYETVYLSGTGKDGGEEYIFNTSTVRYNFAGGRYGSMEALGGQRHHMPSSKALITTGVLSKENGVAVRMLTTDHYSTASYGNTAAATEFRTKEITQIRNGKFLVAQRLGISDLQNLFGSKYDDAINEMVSYTKGLGYKQ